MTGAIDVIGQHAHPRARAFRRDLLRCEAPRNRCGVLVEQARSRVSRIGLDSSDLPARLLGCAVFSHFYKVRESRVRPENFQTRLSAQRARKLQLVLQFIQQRTLQSERLGGRH